MGAPIDSVLRSHVEVRVAVDPRGRVLQDKVEAVVQRPTPFVGGRKHQLPHPSQQLPPLSGQHALQLQHQQHHQQLQQPTTHILTAVQTQQYSQLLQIQQQQQQQLFQQQQQQLAQSFFQMPPTMLPSSTQSLQQNMMRSAAPQLLHSNGYVPNSISQYQVQRPHHHQLAGINNIAATCEQLSNSLASIAKPIRAPRSTRSKARPGLRKGKWTTEEEEYAQALSHYFKQGILPLTKGTMLRLYLAEQLNCEPMRITKKFTGDECIGKQVFRPCQPSASLEATRQKAIKELGRLRERFLTRNAAPGADSNASDSAASSPASADENGVSLKRKLMDEGDDQQEAHSHLPSVPLLHSRRPSIQTPASLSFMTGGNLGRALTPINSRSTEPASAQPVVPSGAFTMTFTSTPRVVGSYDNAEPAEEPAAAFANTAERKSLDVTSAGNLLLDFIQAVNSDKQSFQPATAAVRCPDMNSMKRQRLGSGSVICA